MKNILAAIFILAISVITLEVKPSPEEKVYGKMIGSCTLGWEEIFGDIYVATAYFFGQYYKAVGASVEEVEDMDYMVESILATNRLFGSAAEQTGLQSE